MALSHNLQRISITLIATFLGFRLAEALFVPLPLQHQSGERQRFLV